MRVCFLASSLETGGAERTITYLANSFVKKDTYVDIVIYGNRGIYDLDSKVNVVELRKFNEQKVKNIIIRVKGILSRIIDMRKYYDSHKPDVIICMLYRTFFYTLFLPSKVKIISSERSNPETLKGFFNLRARKYILLNSDGFIFQTEMAQRYFGNTKANSVIIPNAVANMSAYGINSYHCEKTNKICAVGSLKKEKDYPTLFKAFKEVQKKHPQIKLEIFGDGALKNELVKYSEKIGIRDSIDFMGIHFDVLDKIKDSKCYVLSSSSEGMPNSLLEAMAIGLPCVSTNCKNGPAELIENYEDGLLVDVGDYKHMAEAICKFIDDLDFAYQCAKRGQEKIRERHNSEVISEKYLTYISKVCSK